jgi:hypothetical protein
MATTSDVTKVRVKSLEQLVERGQVWGRMAEKYGVTNPVPPWKSSLDGMCDALDQCATVIPSLTRREEEDRLSEHQYAELPFPESQLVSLAHSLIVRGVIDEAALVSRMAAVRVRLESCGPDAKTFPLSSMEGHADEEGKTDNLNRYNEDIYKQVKAHSIQLSRLVDMVESLQSQVKQLQETTKLRKHHKTTSVRKKSTSNNSIKTKKKTYRRESARSRKK